MDNKRSRLMKTNIKPYSKEWHELKKVSIGSTDSCIINGTNKFNGNCPKKLYKIKKEEIEKDEVTDKMKEGMELEKEAILWFEEVYDVKLEQPVYQKAFRAATLDGEFEKDSYVEFKCGEKAYELAKKDCITDYVYTQIQHALEVTDKKKCYNVYFRFGETPIVKMIERDDQFIDELMILENKFNYCLENNIEPHDHFDKEVIRNDVFDELCNVYIAHKDKEKEYKKIADEYKAKLIEMANGERCFNPTTKLIIDKRKESFSYDVQKIIEKFNLNIEELEDCKKKKASFYTLTY